MNDRDVVKTMLKWFQDELHWCKGSSGHRDENGPVNSCLSGAFGVVLRGDPTVRNQHHWGTEYPGEPVFIRLMREVIIEQFPERGTIDDGVMRYSFPVFNDHPDTTIDDVRLVLEKTLAQLEEEKPEGGS